MVCLLSLCTCTHTAPLGGLHLRQEWFLENDKALIVTNMLPGGEVLEARARWCSSWARLAGRLPLKSERDSSQR